MKKNWFLPNREIFASIYKTLNWKLFRYGAKQQCQGVHRKSRRCPTKQCKYCDVISGKQRAVGDKWKADNCQICSCQENQTVHCTK